jgi:hypothetical protein
VQRRSKSFLLVLVDLDVLGARAEHVPKTRTHFAALARLPADAHASLFVLFDVEMTLIIAVFANRDALETSQSAFAVDFAAECFLSSSAWCICGVVAELVGILDASKDLGPRSSSAHPVVVFVFVRARVEVGMSEEVIWVCLSACDELVPGRSA